MSDDSENLRADESAPPSQKDLYFFHGISWTPAIEDAAQLVALWINCDLCGAAIWGLPRVGKSEFAKYFEKIVDEMFGGTVVVVRFRFGGEQFVKDTQLLKRMLSNVGVRATSTREPEPLRTRLMDEIWSRCRQSTRRIVVIVDELQNIAPKLYGEFAILESSISEEGYVPFMLSIGQPELQSTVANVEKNLHVMGRQFQQLVEFRGLSFEQVEEFLRSLDGEDRHFTWKHFPARAARGWSVVQLIEPLKQAVNAICDLEKMNLELFFPMAYLRQTLTYLFFFLIDERNQHEQVAIATVLTAFDQNGFRKLLMSYVKPKVPKPGQEGAP